MKHEVARDKGESMTFTISLAIPDDADAIANINEETWLATYPNQELGITREEIEQFMNTDRLGRRDQWRTTIKGEADRERVWVARNEKDKVIGFCFGFKAETVNKIQAIYVLPDSQGKGIGQQLMKAALDWFGPDKEVHLTVVIYNTKAIEFYQRIGFKEIGIIPPSRSITLPSGKILPEIKMIRDSHPA